MITQEFINVKDAFKEKNREQEYQNEIARGYHTKQIEKLQNNKNLNNKEMEVEDNNNVRVSQSITSFKPLIQNNQFNNVPFGQQVNTYPNETSQQQQISNSKEDKVNKQKTSSSEGRKIPIENMSPQAALEMLQNEEKQNKPSIDWGKLKVDTNCAIVQQDPELLKESLIIIEQQKTADQIVFFKINNKIIFKEYLTEWGIDLDKQSKDIPTGAYLILLLDGNYMNEVKLRFTKALDLNRLKTQIVAFAESISVHAFSTIAYRIEAEKIKLEGSKQQLTQLLTEIIQSKQEHVKDEIRQLRIQTQQQYNINIIIHITVQMKQSKKNLEKYQKKDEEKSKN